MNLTLNLEEELSILDKYGLTPSELLVIRILLILQDDSNEQLLHQMMYLLCQTYPTSRHHL